MPDVKPMRNVMSEYINGQGVLIVMNDDADTLDIKGVVFGRVDNNIEGKKTSSFITPIKKA